ncbi:MAG: formylglycine-generating enzyme family protein [Planctomycetes bacterium]|nr:formylglycine-generating enzyme family protein [Planctomycetota bacterium]
MKLTISKPALLKDGRLSVVSVGSLLFAICLVQTGCSATKTQLGDRSLRGHGNTSMLPDEFVPLTGLDPSNPNHYPDNWPRFIVSNRDNMVMVYVDGGEYDMGSGESRRRVYVDPFYIDMHEVTNSQFDRFRKDRRFATHLRRNWNRPWMESNAFHTYPSEYYPFRKWDKQKLYPEIAQQYHLWRGQNPKDIDFYLDYWEPGHNNDDPVRNVSWWEAWLYTQWSKKMLPTEAQWELAARGKRDGRAFPWGSDAAGAGKLCNSGEQGIDDGHDYVASVMEYSGGVSPYGCYNMAGNVWEWCLNNYDPTIASRPRNFPWVDPYPYEPHEYPGGQMDVDEQVEVNPVGPLHGDQRTLRGGSYTKGLEQCTVTSRRGARPDVHQMDIGFRCILPLPVTESAAVVSQTAAPAPVARRAGPPPVAGPPPESTSEFQYWEVPCESSNKPGWGSSDCN